MKVLNVSLYLEQTKRKRKGEGKWKEERKERMGRREGKVRKKREEGF